MQAESAEKSAVVVAGLVYVFGSEPGIRRDRDGDRFVYMLPDEKPVTDEAELRRIAKLVIPPAYRDVWICINPRGHLQATGYDIRGRKQYRYHPEWRSARDSVKFDRMVAFGEALPKLRRRIRRDLALPGLPRDKVLAVIAHLLDTTRIRIGNAEYARENKSFGLTTLRNRHVQFIRDGRATLSFNGKGGTAHKVMLTDRHLVSLVKRIQHLPGQQLFQYLDDDGARHAVTSDQVNDYLKDATGEDFTAKDFRTWGATLSAISLMAGTPLPELASERALNACIVDTVKKVAADLRNTPAVCRKSYINPVVFVAWRNGDLHKIAREEMLGTPRKAERIALAFLRSQAVKARRAERRAANLEATLTASIKAAKRAKEKPARKPLRQERSRASAPPAQPAKPLRAAGTRVRSGTHRAQRASPSSTASS